MTLRLLPFVICLASACVAPPPMTTDGGTSDGGGVIAPDAGPRGGGFFSRAVGLWSGPADQTPLGRFPVMAMDLRAADARWLVGRTDLDADNSLRFGFSFEASDGGTLLSFRNGGAFGGVVRDTDTLLVDANEAASTYRFCAPESGCFFSVDGGCLPVAGGCSFVEATFTFTAPDRLSLDARVMGHEHLLWTATRQEPRDLPAPFPSDATPVTANAPWPALGQLAATVTWSQPLTQATDVWIILSTTACASLTSPAFTCHPSRSISGRAATGATSITLSFEQLHPGAYNAVALVDTAGTFKATLSPTHGDGLSNPGATVNVPATGQGTTTLPVVYSIP